MRRLILGASATSCCVIFFSSRSRLNLSPNVMLVSTSVANVLQLFIAHGDWKKHLYCA